jgi:Tfp pilus assembly protein PilO
MIGRLSGRIAALVAGLAVVVVMLAGWLLLISPERGKAGDLQTKIDNTAAQLASTEAYVKDPANRRSVSTLAHFKRVLPDDVRMSQVLRQLSVASALAGVRIDAITPAAPVPLNGGQTSPITLVVVGHYFRIAQFMHVLRERAQLVGDVAKGDGRLYSVDSIAFAKNSTAGVDTSGSVLTATVALNVYFYGAGATAPTATSTTTTTTSSATAAPATAP